MYCFYVLSLKYSLQANINKLSDKVVAVASLIASKTVKSHFFFLNMLIFVSVMTRWYILLKWIIIRKNTKSMDH